MCQLYQPVLVNEPEEGHDLKNVLTLRQFIDLLREEEDYWEGEQNNTYLIITRLRKIFYDKWGWDDHLIRKAAKIENRYLVEIVEEPMPGRKKLRYYKNHAYTPKYRKILYRNDDRVYGNTRAGQSPFIVIDDHQEVLLPSGHYCDIAHVLAGVDAFNYRDLVGLLPDGLNFLKLGPHVNFNGDIVTWLGDIASSSGDFFLAYLRNKRKPAGCKQEQTYINIDAPGSDMLGDIDSFVIANFFDIRSEKGKRFTEILEEYYLGKDNTPPIRNRRFELFCKAVNLNGWNGTRFENEDEWLKYYHKQLRDNICFQIFSLTDEKLQNLWILLQIWFNGYQDILKIDELLNIWLSALKEELKKELQ